MIGASLQNPHNEAKVVGFKNARLEYVNLCYVPDSYNPLSDRQIQNN
jgi:hypothetical protein